MTPEIQERIDAAIKNGDKVHYTWARYESGEICKHIPQRTFINGELVHETEIEKIKSHPTP